MRSHTFLNSESISLYAISHDQSTVIYPALEWRMHTRVVGNEEADVGVVQDSSDTDETSTTAGHDGDVLPSVLARLALTVHLVVQSSNSLPQRLDARSWAILAAGGADVDVGRTGEAAFDVVLDLAFVRTGHFTPSSVCMCVCVYYVPQAHPLCSVSPSVKVQGGSVHVHTAQVGPLFGLFEEAKLGSSLGTPYYTGRRPSSV